MTDRVRDRDVNVDDIDLRCVERINVIGTSGSGKSTFARRLAGILDLPYVEMDRLYWGPNWSEPSDAEFLPRVETATAADRWVLDGNYSRTTPIKWRRVQLVVWLDLSFPRTVSRVIGRCLRRSWSGTELWPGTGNVETLAKSFLSRDSIILWAITSYRRNRARYGRLFTSGEYPAVHFIRLRSPQAVTEFLRTAERTVLQRHVESGSGRS